MEPIIIVASIFVGLLSVALLIVMIKGVRSAIKEHRKENDFKDDLVFLSADWDYQVKVNEKDFVVRKEIVFEDLNARVTKYTINGEEVLKYYRLTRLWKTYKYYDYSSKYKEEDIKLVLSTATKVQREVKTQEFFNSLFE